MAIVSQNTDGETVKKYAVVTGASRGLGRAFAKELAQRGIPTILVSSNPAIADVCSQLCPKQAFVSTAD